MKNFTKKTLFIVIVISALYSCSDSNSQGKTEVAPLKTKLASADSIHDATVDATKSKESVKEISNQELVEKVKSGFIIDTSKVKWLQNNFTADNDTILALNLINKFFLALENNKIDEIKKIYFTSSDSNCFANRYFFTEKIGLDYILYPVMSEETTELLEKRLKSFHDRDDKKEFRKRNLKSWYDSTTTFEREVMSTKVVAEPSDGKKKYILSRFKKEEPKKDDLSLYWVQVRSTSYFTFDKDERVRNTHGWEFFISKCGFNEYKLWIQEYNHRLSYEGSQGDVDGWVN